MTEGGLGFESGAKSIHFAGDERISCNGVEFPTKDRSAVFPALRAPTAQGVGTTLRCDFVVGGNAASEPAVKRMIKAELVRVAGECRL